MTNNPSDSPGRHKDSHDAAPQGETPRDRRNPPKATRFKPGQSGNPAGRPKGATGRRKAVRNVLLEKRAVRIAHSQEPELCTTLKLVFMVLREKAFKGDRRAIKTLQDFDAEYNRSAEPPPPGVGFLVVPERLTQEEWTARFTPKDEPPPIDDDSE